VQQIFTLTTQMESRAMAAAAAYKDARALAEKIKARAQSSANDALIKQVEDIAPAQAPAAEAGAGGGRGGRGGFGAPAEPLPPATLATVGGRMVGAVMPMQASEMPPTAAQLHACAEQEAAYTALMAKWTALKPKLQ